MFPLLLKCILRLADLCIQQDVLQNVERIVRKCQELLSRIPGHSDCEVLVANTMVRLLLRRGELDAAHHLQLKNMALLKQVGVSPYSGQTYQCLAMVHYMQSQMHLSFQNIRKAITLSTQYIEAYDPGSESQLEKRLSLS